MSVYIGNELKDRLKILEMENSLLRKYNEYHQVVHESYVRLTYRQ